MSSTSELIQMEPDGRDGTTVVADPGRDGSAGHCSELAYIIEQQRAEMLEQQTRLLQIERRFYGSEVATIFLDAEMRIQFFTPAITHFFGMIKSDLGRPVTDLRTGVADHTMASAAQRVFDGKNVPSEQIQTAEGAWYLRRTLPYRAEGERIDGVILVFTDITDIKKESLRQDQSLRQHDRKTMANLQHVAEVSHNLRQPLLALTLLRETLFKRAHCAEDTRLVEQLRSQVCAIADMVDSLIEDGTRDTGTESLLSAGSSECGATVPQSEMPGLSPSDQCFQPIAKSYTDVILILTQDTASRSPLTQALHAAGYRVIVARSPAAAIGMIQNGSAMPDVLLVDLDGLDTPGRPCAQMLRDQLGVMLPVLLLTNDASLPATYGTALPYSEMLPKSAPIQHTLSVVATLLRGERCYPKSEPEAQRQQAVFVIDQDPVARAATRFALETAGRIVHEYANGDDFIEVYRPEFASCLVVDANLPGMSGLQILQWLRAAGDPLPTILVTRYCEVAIAVQAMKAGASDFIVKPVTSIDLVESVQRAISKSTNDENLSDTYINAFRRLNGLTPREHQIMEMVLDGQASKRIAMALAISQRTVENHRASIMKKTGSKSLPALARLAGAASQNA